MRAWQRVSDSELSTGADKSSQSADFIAAKWAERPALRQTRHRLYPALHRRTCWRRRQFPCGVRAHRCRPVESAL